MEVGKKLVEDLDALLMVNVCFRHTHFAVNFHENLLFPINFHHDRIGISLLKRLISLSDFDGPARE